MGTCRGIVEKEAASEMEGGATEGFLSPVRLCGANSHPKP